MGFVVGLFEFSRIGGIACLGIVGGLAIGMRIVVFKSGLLIPLFFVNWLIVTACGVCSLLLMLWNQRITIVSGHRLPCLICISPMYSAIDVMHLFHRHIFHRLRR